MRRIFKSFMLVAAAAMAFTSCQKEETAAPETVSATLTMHADVEQTKTYLDEENKVLWGKGEAVTLYVGSGETAKFFDSASTDTYEGASTASFAFDIQGVTEADSYTLGGIYPASAAIDDNDDPKKCKTILPQIQNAELGKYDPAAYIMVLKPETVETLPEEYVASFRRATALNKITLTNVKEDITTVEITVPEGKALAGRRYFNLTDGESGEIYYGQSNAITVNSQYSGSTIDVWFCSWGVELAAGEELTVRMKNANKSFTRTIQAKEAGIKFVEGDLNTLKINMETAEEESFDSFAGEWLITGTSGSVTYAAGAYVSGKNNLNNNIAITIENDVIAPVDGLENCKMLLTKITEGDYEGMYTIQDANGKYLYAAASGSNHLKATESASSEHYYWTVECNDGKYSIVASKSSNRKVMQFNPNNGSPIFACYASASQTAVVLYPYSMVKEDTTPRIAVTDDTTKDVVFGGETVTFNYELKYLDGEALSWEVSDEEMISEVTAEDGVLSVTVAENDGKARTATITLSCGDAEEVVLTINQAEYVDTSVIEKITVAEFLEKSVDANVWYELTGTVSGISNTTYGNFNLVDATGTVYVYGLTATKVASNDQSFATIGLNEGDVVTLIGTRAVYNNSAQVGGPAYYVSHQQVSVAPSISCKDNVVTITAAAAATIYYTTNGDEPTTESTEYSAPFEITENTTVKAIAIEDGKLVSTVAVAECTWVDPDAENEGVSLGASYSYTFTATQWSANNSSKTLGTLSWTASGTYNGSGYWGYDGTKGQQFGSAKAAAKSLNISTSSYSGGVKTIKVSTSGASSINAKLTVTVNGKQYGSTVSLTSSNKEYTFEVADADVQAGEIVLSYANSSAKAIYIKSIAIN